MHPLGVMPVTLSTGPAEQGAGIVRLRPATHPGTPVEVTPRTAAGCRGSLGSSWREAATWLESLGVPMSVRFRVVGGVLAHAFVAVL